MKNYKIAAEIAAMIALAVVFSAPPAVAQDTTSTPIIALTTNSGPVPVAVRQIPPKMIWLKAEVVHADAHSITVRERGKELAIHTFTYSEDLQDGMRQISDAGGYQYGDKVKILYQQGQTVALRVKGKPSL
ncbi:MAG TPA: hypothetical protein VMB02_08470 [Candidatus Aquilonibacter sp.]|nr:hypothetical protein [Candidatus Aquilonibacter sp.]